MGGRPRINTNLAGRDFSDLSEKDLKSEFLRTLKKGIHGISFSVYFENQVPGSLISAEQIHERMQIIKPYVKWFIGFSKKQSKAVRVSR